MRRETFVFIGLVTACFIFPARSMGGVPVPEIYARSSSNVLLLEGKNSSDEIVMQASAIALGDGIAVTQCDLLAGAEHLAVTQGRRRFTAYSRERDEARNLCQLDVPGLRATKTELVPIEQIRIGQSAYAIGNALGMGLSLSEGIVSGIREYSGMSWIQTTAALAPGSEGGALLDDRGRLLGMTNYRRRDGQNINFAAPAAWLPEISQRAAIASEGQADNARRAAGCSRLAGAEDWQALAVAATEWSRSQPEQAEAWSWLGLAKERQEDFQAAAEAYGKSLERGPESVSTALALARNQMRLKQADKALEVLRGAIAYHQEEAELWFARVQAEDALDLGEDGLRSLQETLRLDPRHLGAWEVRFNIARARNDADGLRQAAANLTEIAPDNAHYWLLRAQTNLALGRLPQALKAIGRAEELVPGEPDYLITRGAILSAFGAYGQAIDTLKRGLEGNQSGQQAYGLAQLGNAYYQVDLYPEAIVALRAAVKLAPDQFRYQYELGLALKDGGREAEALEQFLALRAKAEQDPLFWRQLGFVNAKLGRDEDAVGALEQSLRLAPEQAKVWHALGESYGRLERIEDVRRAYQRLRSLDPERAEQLYRAFLLLREAQP